jgi:hypothetical protein
MPRHYAIAASAAMQFPEVKPSLQTSLMEDVFVDSGENRLGPSCPDHYMTFSLHTVAPHPQRREKLCSISLVNLL